MYKRNMHSLVYAKHAGNIVLHVLFREDAFTSFDLKKF